MRDTLNLIVRSQLISGNGGHDNHGRGEKVVPGLPATAPPAQRKGLAPEEVTNRSDLFDGVARFRRLVATAQTFGVSSASRLMGKSANPEARSRDSRELAEVFHFPVKLVYRSVQFF